MPRPTRAKPAASLIAHAYSLRQKKQLDTSTSVRVAAYSLSPDLQQGGKNGNASTTLQAHSSATTQKRALVTDSLCRAKRVARIRRGQSAGSSSAHVLLDQSNAASSDEMPCCVRETSSALLPRDLPKTISTLLPCDPSESRHCVGVHVSAAGGLDNAIFNAKAMGCKAFAFFLKSQRQWAAKPLDDGIAVKFKEACKVYGYPPHLILPHGSYLLNCGAPNKEVLLKSRATLLDELQRCEKLGLLLYNFHPGSTCGEITIEECITEIAESINLAHGQTQYAIAVVENMCGQGNTIGGKFEELANIIGKVKDKTRIGVCLDTCHAFAAGYDLSTEIGYDKMMEEFDKIVGLKYLKGMHLNDSKGSLGCHLDRHANIGKGCIGKGGFTRIMNDYRLANIPLILETPYVSNDAYAEEVKFLYSMCTKSVSG